VFEPRDDLADADVISSGGEDSGAFAGGTADGRQWELVAENIADPGFRCVPAVSINGNDADPLFADPDPQEQSPVGDPAFVTVGSRPIAGLTGLPGYGYLQFWPAGQAS
jgi:hypothetical protein